MDAQTAGLYGAILEEELLMAQGCTEPVAIAYCAALARDLLAQPVRTVQVRASGNLIKNAKSVVVPGTGGLKGIGAAVAAGIVAGDTTRALQVIAALSDADRAAMQRFLEEVPIEVTLLESGDLLDMIVSVTGPSSGAKVRIAKTHVNIIYMEKDGIPLSPDKAQAVPAKAKTDRSVLNIEGIYSYAGLQPEEHIVRLIERQIACNTAIAREGMRGDWGANIGKVLLKEYGENIKVRAKAMAAAGSDARMAGCELPVVINSGSGNQGLAVSLPVLEYAREVSADNETLIKALILANLVAIHLKTGLGTLSAYCGAVSAGTGAGAGIAYLLGGDCTDICHTIVNALAIASGIVCDGAKPSCAAKVSAGVDAGIMGYAMYINGQQFRAQEGLVSKGVENTIDNIARLGREGMRSTDKEIIRIMLNTN